MSLEGRVVVVTGAGQGIGRAIATGALELGASVVAVDVNAEAIGSLANERVLAVAGSVAEEGFAQTVVDAAVARFGAVHGLVNNAGIVRAAMINKMSAEAWRQVIDVNMSGAFYFLQAVGRHMTERVKDGDATAGSIVNIASDAGRRGTIGQINYAASKAALAGMSMSAAREWGKAGVRVNTVAFGVVETPMTETIRGEALRDTYLAQIPLRRWASPEEVATPVLFLLSDGASYITGQQISVNGGYHMAA